MPKFGFVGPSYESASVTANAQKCVNLYVEKDESGTGKSPFQLLATPGSRTFAHLYDDIIGLSIVPYSHQGTDITNTLPDGTYYAALALIDANGNCDSRSRVFGPFTAKYTVATPPQTFPPDTESFQAIIPILPPAGSTWFIYFGTSRSALTQQLPLTGLTLPVITPGIAATLPESSTANAVVKGITVDDRCFVTSQNALWQLYSDGYARFLYTIANDLKPKVFAASPLEILLSSGGHAYLYNFANDVTTEIPVITAAQIAAAEADPTITLNGFQAAVVSVGFADSYFIALMTNGRFQISGVLNGSTWDPADIAQESVYADTPTAMAVDHREIVITGPKQSIVYYDSGNPFFPFEVVPGSFAEFGIGAPASFLKADNTLFWIGQDERGGGMAWRAQGYLPTRISTHAIEEHWRTFVSITDAVGYSYQEAGHTFVCFYFPLANETWVYDVATGMWHERTKHFGCHFFAFGKHLFGDVATGTIFESSLDLLTHDGAEIRRVRTTPYISEELQWIFHRSLQIDVETGRGPTPPLLDGHGEPRGPQLMMRHSDDGCHTWSNEQTFDCGKTGEYKKRVVARRLGRSRSRIYEVVVTDPVPWRFIDAYLNFDPVTKSA